MAEDILIVKKEGTDLKLKLVGKGDNRMQDRKYQKIISLRNPSQLGEAFFDLDAFGVPIKEAIKHFEKLGKRDPIDILFPKD